MASKNGLDRKMPWGTLEKTSSHRPLSFSGVTSGVPVAQMHDANSRSVQRDSSSCEAVVGGAAETITINELEDICYQTIEMNKAHFNDTDEHRLLINVSRGPLGIYAPVFDYKMEPTVVVADFPLKWTVAYMGKLYDEGINAVLVNQRAIPAHLMDPKIKNRSRVFYQMANIEASMFRGKNNWALMMDTDGFIAEGSGDNFFIVKNGTVITPEGRNC